MYKLIIGLGNPGEAYKNNFHNLGFKVLDEFNLDFNYDNLSKSEICFLDNETILCKPMMYMNNSGLNVRWLVEKYNISLSNILVIHDDLSVKIGKFRYENFVSKTSHNGIRSILNELNGNNFSRIRVGCSKPKQYEDIETLDYVLMDIPEDIEKTYKTIFPDIKNFIEGWISERE